LNIARAHALVNCFNQHDGGYVKRKALIAIALLIATKVVFAQNKHPADMAAIDAAMQTAKLTPRLEQSGSPLHRCIAIEGGADLANGAQGRDRTTDTAIFSRMLYQLSYLGTALA
jgi:hypothetical protein